MASSNGWNSNQVCTEEYVDDGDDEGYEDENHDEADEDDTGNEGPWALSVQTSTHSF